MTLTRHSPQPVPGATPVSDACCVLETPPLPVTPPQRGDRGHDLMAESSLLTFSSTTLRPRVAVTPKLTCHRLNGTSRSRQIRKRAVVRCSALCTPGMGVSVGVEVPCRRFTFMNRKIHEANYESKARASPRGGV